MADPQVRIEARADSSGDTPADDIEMSGQTEGRGGDDDDDNGLEIEAPSGEAEAEADEVIAEASTIEDRQRTFLDYLRSPIVELGIGPEDEQVTLTAHQGLLARSPFFVRALEQFSDDVTSRRIDMPSENLDAMGCFLQFLYTGEYYPRLLAGDKLEIQEQDDGTQLLRHGRIYTLAQKFQVDDLADLALNKIHRVGSSVQGEIQYAKYIYANTTKKDERVRKPIATFWGSRSHVLRHMAEDEFKELCLEFPEFAFDVLSTVLDSRERRAEKESSQQAELTKSGRKRQRNG